MTFNPHAHFQVANIRLVGSTFETIAVVESEKIGENSIVQTRRWITPDIRAYQVGDLEQSALFVTVHLGMRLLRVNADGDSTQEVADDVIFRLEAAFRAEFKIINSSYAEADFQQFIDVNATHIVWPFWREHVFSTLRKACLPAVEVPLMAPATPTQSAREKLVGESTTS